MKKKKVLPIETDIPVYTYSYYGYPHSIIAAKEHTGDHVATIEVKDYDQYRWIENFDNYDVIKKNDSLEIHANHPYMEDLHGVSYRPLKEVDAIYVSIHFQQYAHPWGAVNLFIDGSPEEELILGDDNYLCRLGYFNREGVYLRIKNQTKHLEYNQKEFPVNLMLCKDHDIVEAFLCEGGTKYLLYQERLQELAQRDLKIGVQIRGNENTYYHWLYRNYIQISCDVDDSDRTMDYFYGVEKDWRFDWYNFFLNSYKMPQHMINEYGSLKFIKECIDDGKYIELLLDQYHVADRVEYHTIHALHQNLIYGYDDAEKIVHLLGYKNHGKLTLTTISYSDIKYQFEKRHCVKEIHVVEYEQDAYGIEYRGSYIKKMLRQYLDGYNSSQDLAHLMEPRKRVYGIDCYDALLSEKGMKRLLSDRRVSHLLYEHKALMLDRFRYMSCHGEFDSESLQSISTEYSKVVKTAFNVRALAVKYIIKEDEGVIDTIRTGLMEMREEEKRILSCIL